jgi:flagellar biosynthesis/type III secretory pathway chaperone
VSILNSSDCAEGAIELRQSARQGLKLLISELSLQTRHKKVIADQGIALLACNKTKFVSLQDDYVQLLGELDVQHKLRSAFFGDQTVDQAIAHWPSPERQNAQRVATELKSVLSDVRRINAQNCVLIGSQMKYIDFMLDLLVKTHRKGNMYGPQGASSASRGTLLVNRAA